MGRDIKRYQPPESNQFLILIPKGWTRGKSHNAKDAWGWLQKNYPAIARHLAPYAIPGHKRYDKGEYWWELRACDYYQEFEKPKIIFPDISQRGNFTIDMNVGFFSVNTTYFFTNNDLYLLGLLNSNLMTFFYGNNYAVFRGGYLRFFEQYLRELPIRMIDSSNKGKRDRIIFLVKSMLSLHKQLDEVNSVSQKEIIQRQIYAMDAEIDRLVYELYGLTEEEITIVEKETKRR